MSKLLQVLLVADTIRFQNKNIPPIRWPFRKKTMIDVALPDLWAFLQSRYILKDTRWSFTISALEMVSARNAQGAHSG